MKELYQLISSKIEVNDEDWDYLKDLIQEKSLSKKELLLKAPKVEKHLYFIQEGVFRIYLELEEKDITVDFGFPGDMINSYTSFLTQSPSEVHIQSLTPAKVLYLSKNDLEDFYQNTKSGNAIGRIFAEELFLYKSKREFSFLKDSPTQRYLNLFEEQPALIQQIPQNYLASYIGITPQALSRIRAKIFEG